MNSSSRTTLLLVVTLVLIGAVLADRAGLIDKVLGGGGGAAGEAYRAKAHLVAEQEAIAAQRAAWERSAMEAREAVEALGDRVIRQRTVQLAEDELGKQIKLVMENTGLATVSTQSATPGAAREDGVRRIGKKVIISTENPALINQFVDRLENLGDLITSIERIELRGPGVTQARGELEATITVMGLAIIDGGAA